MKKVPENHSQPVQQFVVLLNNSKYSYAEFTTFHQTVLHLLEHNDLTHLDVTQTKNTMFFIKIVKDLLDAPTIEAGDVRNSSLEMLINRSAKIVQPELANEDLEKLLGWIDTLVIRNHVTIEEMLDQFFLLRINNLW